MPLQRDQIVHNAPRCLVCRYDLTGFGVGDICPECGHRIEILYETPEDSDLANTAVYFGLTSIACFGLACLVPPMLVAALPMGTVGAIVAIIARSRILMRPARYGRQSMLRARLGFWLSVPGLAVTGLLIAAFIKVVM